MRCYNPPRFDSPFGWLSRDHRKMLAIDGEIGFITGLCIGRNWEGIPEKKIAPWRDTGVEVRGPAVADIESIRPGLGDDWCDPLPRHARRAPSALRPEGDVSLRVVAGRSGHGRDVPAGPIGGRAGASERVGSPTPTTPGRRPTCRR